MNITFMSGKLFIGISLCLFILSVFSFGQYIDYESNNPNIYTDYSENVLISSDTSPPDTFDTPIVVDSITVDSLKVSFTPSEIDSADWKDIVLSLTSRDGLSWSNIVIPRATALADSDTIIYLNPFTYNTGIDTSDIISVVATVRDSSNNGLSMTAVESPEFLVNTPRPSIDSLVFRTNLYPGYIDYRFVKDDIYVNQGVLDEEVYFALVYLDNGTHRAISSYQSFNSQQYNILQDSTGYFLLDLFEYSDYTVGDTFLVVYRYLGYGSDVNTLYYKGSGSLYWQTWETVIGDSLFYPDTTVAQDTLPPNTAIAASVSYGSIWDIAIDYTGSLSDSADVAAARGYVRASTSDSWSILYHKAGAINDTTISLSSIISTGDSIYFKIAAIDSSNNEDPTGVLANCVFATDNFYIAIDRDSLTQIRFGLDDDTTSLASVDSSIILSGKGGSGAVIDTSNTNNDSTVVKIPEADRGYYFAYQQQLLGSWTYNWSEWAWWSPASAIGSFVAQESATSATDSIRLVLSAYPTSFDSIRFSYNGVYWFSITDSVADTTVYQASAEAGTPDTVTALIYLNGTNSGQVGWAQQNSDTVNVPTAGGGATYLWSNDWEGSGNEMTIGGSTVDTNYATSPAPLNGSFSALLDNGASGSPTLTGGYYDSTAAEQWFAFTFRFPGDLPASNCETMHVTGGAVGNEDALFGTQYRTAIQGMRIYAGGSSVDTRILSADSTYKIKVRYQAGTGANAETQVWLGTPTVGAYRLQGTATNGTETRHGRWIDFSPSATIDIIIDDVKVDDADITW